MSPKPMNNHIMMYKHFSEPHQQPQQEVNTKLSETLVVTEC